MTSNIFTTKRRKNILKAKNPAGQLGCWTEFLSTFKALRSTFAQVNNTRIPINTYTHTYIFLAKTMQMQKAAMDFQLATNKQKLFFPHYFLLLPLSFCVQYISAVETHYPP